MAVSAPEKDETSEPTPTRLFQNGNSQAVRIPKDLAFNDVETEVEILRRGDEIIVRPVKRKLTGLGDAFRRLGEYFKDFERDQGEQEERDWSGYGGAKK